MTIAQLAVFAAIAVLLMQGMKQHITRFSCPYCGKYKGHDDHCPYLM